MKTTILWDNDGVLVDTEEVFFDACCQTLKRRGVEGTREDFIRLNLSQGKTMFSLGVGTAYQEEDIPTIRDERNEIYEEMLQKESKEIPGIRLILEHFHGKVKMGVVTSSPRKHFKMIHEHTGFEQFFDFVVNREDFREEKPSPESYREGIKRAGAQASECVAVEDSFRGYLSATRAGIDCIVIRTSLNKNIEFPDALRVVETVDGLFSYLRELFNL